MTTQPVSDVVRVNLNDAVRDLAVKDGVTDSSELQKVVGVKRFDQYAAQVRSYYAGYDVGYAEGLLLNGPALGRYGLRMALLGAVAGAALALSAWVFVVPYFR